MARVLNTEYNTVHHLTSRIAHRAFFLKEDERDDFIDLMLRVSAFSGVELLSWCVLDNHFHIYAYLPNPPMLSDDEVLRRFLSLSVWDRPTPLSSVPNIATIPMIVRLGRGFRRCRGTITHRICRGLQMRCVIHLAHPRRKGQKKKPPGGFREVSFRRLKVLFSRLYRTIPIYAPSVKMGQGLWITVLSGWTETFAVEGPGVDDTATAE